ncbi:fluoride efflux transporter FluC [Radiobacillus sp. PE A8.2]|uniref:fluoride efflux transporter FluC n=1 Tax=Radiobacillus sp. PE A8.2 TaxID=3380349 RepID=UPI00388FBA1D
MEKQLIILIGVSGALGATVRYSIALIPMTNNLPLPTLLVNWIGCFLLAFLARHAFLNNKLPQPILMAISTGFIGSLTTFSTFSLETVGLYSENVYLAFCYVLLSIVGGFYFCYAGFRLATRKETAKS